MIWYTIIRNINFVTKIFNGEVCGNEKMCGYSVIGDDTRGINRHSYGKPDIITWVQVIIVTCAYRIHTCA